MLVARPRGVPAQELGRLDAVRGVLVDTQLQALAELLTTLYSRPSSPRFPQTSPSTSSPGSSRSRAGSWSAAECHERCLAASPQSRRRPCSATPASARRSRP
eukprot:15162693-Heterocapsa_arctica.AAC.1